MTTDDEETTGPIIEVTIAAPVDAVWSALRDPDLIRRWHGWESDGLEDEIRQIYVDVTSESPAERTYLVEGHDRFDVVPTGDRTLVRITRAPRGTDPKWDAWYEDITTGWTAFIHQLWFGLERHGLAARRTVAYEGALAVGGSGIDTLGLRDLHRLAQGARWSARVGPGDDLSGTVWGTGPAFLALTVDGLGDGFLVVGDHARRAGRPEGGTVIVLTAYRVDEAAFAPIAQRWSAWFASVRGEDCAT